jgi:hypothetical protein
MTLRNLIKMSNMRIMRSGAKEEAAILYILKLTLGAGLIDEDQSIFD